jgi:hypothetical protein
MERPCADDKAASVTRPSAVYPALRPSLRPTFRVRRGQRSAYAAMSRYTVAIRRGTPSTSMPNSMDSKPLTL